MVRTVEPGGDGPPDGVEKRPSRDLPEFESGAGTGPFIVVFHRVVQAAGGADDGQGAIEGRVHLVQAARLEERGHEKEVAAGLDQVGEFGKKPIWAFALSREGVVQPAEEVS